MKKAKAASAFVVTVVMTVALTPRAVARAETMEDADAGSARPDDARPGGIAFDSPRRPTAKHHACSFRLPLCVHGSAPRPVLEVLASAEASWDLLTGALAFPPPDPDPDTRAYDVYLVDALDEGARTFATARDPRTRVDRASAFTLVDRGLRGCARDAAIARELARAVLFRASPATDDGTARAETAYLARLLVPCAGITLGPGDERDAIATFQANPDHAIIDAWPDADPRAGTTSGARSGVTYDRGASLFFWWLDASFSVQPAGIVRARWALSPTMTPLGAWRWIDEPDAFDVLRVTFKNALTTNSTLDDLLLDFAAARPFFGDADDGTHLVESRALGAIPPRLDWEIDWPASPRRLSAARPIAPTGASYVAIRHAGAPPGARLRIEATWEEHAKMRWVVLKRDAAGREIGRVLVPSVERAVEAQVTVVDLDAADSVLVVGVNTGDASYAFDPDDAVWEPHGWLLTVAAQ